MRVAIAAAVLILAGSFASPSLAATVESIHGEVLVNRGTGFQRVSGVVHVNPGDTVMVSPGGKARVIYADGCPDFVSPGAVVRVSEQSPCAAHAQIPPVIVPAFPAAAAFGAPAAVVGGMIVRDQFLQNQANDRPASP
jgi:hypothetical protein